MVSGVHARPRPAPPIRLSLYRPLLALAALGLTPPIAIISGIEGTVSTPASSFQPSDRAFEAVAEAHMASQHSCRCGSRTGP